MRRFSQFKIMHDYMLSRWWWCVLGDVGRRGVRRSSDACARPSRENCMKLVKVNCAKEFLSRALLKLPPHLNGAVFRNIFIMILEYC